MSQSSVKIGECYFKYVERDHVHFMAFVYFLPINKDIVLRMVFLALETLKSMGDETQGINPIGETMKSQLNCVY